MMKMVSVFAAAFSVLLLTYSNPLLAQTVDSSAKTNQDLAKEIAALRRQDVEIRDRIRRLEAKKGAPAALSNTRRVQQQTPATSAMAAVAAPVYNWTGFYVGGNVGYGWATADNDLSISQLLTPGPFATLSGTDSNKIKGFVGGFQVGYNWQFNPNWLLGVEADIQASGQKGTAIYNSVIINPFIAASNPATVTETNKLDWFGTVRGRLGFTSGRWLVYETAGLAYGKVKVSGNAQPANPSALIVNAPIVWDQSSTKFGWTIGAGVENAVSSNWSWKIEYLYVDLGSVTANPSGGMGTTPVGPRNCYGAGGSCSTTAAPASGTVTSRLTNNIVRVGINYKFR